MLRRCALAVPSLDDVQRPARPSQPAALRRAPRGGCAVGSRGRGPAIRNALPLRPPEWSRVITRRPALRPFGAGAGHLAAAAPKRARRRGALRGGCLMGPEKTAAVTRDHGQKRNAGFGKTEPERSPSGSGALGRASCPASARADPLVFARPALNSPAQPWPAPARNARRVSALSRAAPEAAARCSPP